LESEAQVKRKILAMDRPCFWGSPPMDMIKNLLPQLREAAPGFEVEYLEAQAGLDAEDEAIRTGLTRDAIAGAEIVVAFDLRPAAFAQADRLQWAHILSAGVEHTLYPELIDSPVVLTAAKGSGGIPMAEFAMLQMLLWNKHALHYLDAQRRRSGIRGPTENSTR
jgi:phosphoglycerate dehydrogenase-like enzyme